MDLCPRTDYTKMPMVARHGVSAVRRWCVMIAADRVISGQRRWLCSASRWSLLLCRVSTCGARGCYPAANRGWARMVDGARGR